MEKWGVDGDRGDRGERGMLMAEGENDGLGFKRGWVRRRLEEGDELRGPA